MKRTVILMAVVLIGAYVVLKMIHPGPASPWESSGRLVLVAYAIPSVDRSEERVFGVGIDNVMLTTAGGSNELASLRTRRVLLASNVVKRQVILETNAPVGEYSGIRLIMKSPLIRASSEDDDAPEAVRLKNEAIALDIPYTVTEDETTVILFGMETFQALHEEDGASVFLPVLQTETRSGATVVEEGDAVRIEGGAITASATYGMDWNGSMRYNYRAPHTSPLDEAREVASPPVSIPQETASVPSAGDATTSATTTVEEDADSGQPEV